MAWLQCRLTFAVKWHHHPVLVLPLNIRCLSTTQASALRLHPTHHLATTRLRSSSLPLLLTVSSTTAAPPTALIWDTLWVAGSRLTMACLPTPSSPSTTTRMPTATTASTLRPRCTTSSNARTALDPWTTRIRCVDKRCGPSINLRRVLLAPCPVLQGLSLARLFPEMNLETPQDPRRELMGSSKCGQAKQPACTSHKTHLSLRRWSSTGRENYRIYPESRPSRLDWNGWLSVHGV
jgi:hypothetical protein